MANFLIANLALFFALAFNQQHQRFGPLLEDQLSSRPSRPPLASAMSPTTVKCGLAEPLSLLPSLLSPWKNHPDYGLVHSSGCAICRPYMDHVAEASYSNSQPSFQ